MLKAFANGPFFFFRLGLRSIRRSTTITIMTITGEGAARVRAQVLTRFDVYAIWEDFTSYYFAREVICYMGRFKVAETHFRRLLESIEIV